MPLKLDRTLQLCWRHGRAVDVTVRAVGECCVAVQG